MPNKPMWRSWARHATASCLSRGVETMNVVRLDAAPPYDAPGHDKMHMLRLQGREAGASDVLWLGLSHLLPGGGTTLEASPLEKMYVVLNGEVTISNGREEIGRAHV